jgi:hypothetical protein
MEIEFRFPIVRAAMVLIGAPVMLLTGVVVTAGAAFTLFRLDPPTGIAITAVAVVPLGIASFALGVFGIRFWYVPLTKYLVTNEGIEVHSVLESNSFRWDALRRATYCRATQQLELAFENSRRLVVLTNVDLDPLKQRLKAGVAMVEHFAPVPIKRTWI